MPSPTSRPHLRRIAGPVAVAALCALARPSAVPPGHGRPEALVAALAREGFVARPGDVRFLDGPAGLAGALWPRTRAVVLASTKEGEPRDLYLVESRVSPEGVLLEAASVANLTTTPAADETALEVRRGRVLYLAQSLLEGGGTQLHRVDLDAGPTGAADFSLVERFQVAITNWQEIGRLGGVRRIAVGIEPPPAELAFVPAAGGARALRAGDGTEIPLDPIFDDGPEPAGVALVVAETSRPGNLVTWAVDRVRAVVGDETMQTVKAVAFTALDAVLRSKEAVTDDSGAEGIAEDLGQAALDPPERTIPTDPEIGWPPAPLEPWVTPPLPGEGVWNPQDKDPFVRVNPGLPPAFLTTFVRSDRSRKATRVYVALWDPRQVELHMMAGTVEPKGATGEAGPGLIPRTPEVMKRVVAASNAGFQALHGEFGMMADGVVYLPPKPYAATVVELRDGSTAFGTWPEDPTIPPTVRSYRQNMTVMVQDEKFNPYNRTWWGGTPPGWADKTHTVRTGICLTRERFVAYFYGADISPEALAQAMIQTRCQFGLALDMNAGHSGLEFYTVDHESVLPPLGRPLETSWEAEGEVSGLEGYRYRGRRLIRGMGLMNFPRYIRRESRDYFYMLLRHVLPGPALIPVASPEVPGEGTWQLKGLPQHGFPYALARTRLRPDAGRPDLAVVVLKIDPRTVKAEAAAKAAGPEDKTVLVVDAEPAAGPSTSIWHSTGAFAVGPTAPVPGSRALFAGAPAENPPPAVVAAAGVNDEDGMLVYVEVDPRAGGGAPGVGAGAPDGGTPPAPSGATVPAEVLGKLLATMGVTSPIWFTARPALALGGDTSLEDAAVHAPNGPRAVRLARAEAPGGRRIFEDTPVVPFQHWYALQQQRVRYFKKPQKAADDE